MVKDRAHLARVAALGCVICGFSQVEIHHTRKHTGMGRKESDLLAIPLCVDHHRGQNGFHTLGTRAWETKFGAQAKHLQTVYKLLGIQ